MNINLPIPEFSINFLYALIAQLTDIFRDIDNNRATKDENVRVTNIHSLL